MLNMIENKFDIRMPIALPGVLILLLLIYTVWQSIKIFNKLTINTTMLDTLRKTKYGELSLILLENLYFLISISVSWLIIRNFISPRYLGFNIPRIFELFFCAILLCMIIVITNVLIIKVSRLNSNLNKITN